MSRIPVAGAVWGTMHYLIGLRRLGYDPYYIEAHGRNPSMLMEEAEQDASALAAAFIGRVMEQFDLQRNWCYHAPHEGRYFGLSEVEAKQLYRDAALIINYHGATVPLPEFTATNRLIYLETDPVDTEIGLHLGHTETIEFLEPHCAFFTWGLNYGNADCRVPPPERVNPRFKFKKMPPVVVADLWEDAGKSSAASGGSAAGCKRFTTIGNWRQDSRPPITFEGEVYTWSKHYEFLKFIDLPQRTAQPFELALSRCDRQDDAMLNSHGWHVRDALAFSRELEPYRTYIHRSRGEFTVAKDQNVRLRSGWFSERSAQYMAAGRPVITQDTGFGSYLPTGKGLFPFSTMNDVLAAVDSINSDYPGHCRAASDIARQYMNYDVVIPRLLSESGV